MKQVWSCVLVLFMMESIAPPMLSATPGESAVTSVRAKIDSLKIGKLVTLTFASGQKVKGSVIGKTEQSLQLRVRRGFFTYREEMYPVADIVSVKTHLPAWVGPVVGVGVVLGVVIGVAACAASGACLS